MSVLDIFADDAFSVVELTTAINKLPTARPRLASMNIFRQKPVSTTTVAIEERQGRLSLLKTAARSSMPNLMPAEVRKVHAFPVPFVPANDAVLADDVQGVRAFGSETEVELISTRVNDKLTSMRMAIEITHEYHMAGALQGVIYEPDGVTEIANLFDAFNIVESVVDFDFDNDDAKFKCLEVIRLVEDFLGATPYQRVHALCGDEWFDSFIQMDGVHEAYTLWSASNTQAALFFQTQQAAVGGNVAGFDFGDITFHNYRGKVGSRNFLPSDEARFFPMGVPDLFEEYTAPAPFIETVNTMGQRFYAKQERMKWDAGVELHANSSTLFMCTRPSVLIKGVRSSS